MNLLNRFYALFEIVFDQNGQVNLCGRSKCQELIILSKQIAQIIDEFEHMDFGNANTGVMNTENIQRFYNHLKNVKDLNQFFK